jgi:hypothetical protein
LANTIITGWNAPRKSLLLVHPDGAGSKATNEDLNISFVPTPDYAGIAKAASGGKIWAGCARSAKELGELLPEAIESVKGGVGAVLEVRLDGAFTAAVEENVDGVNEAKMEGMGEKGVNIVINGEAK